MKKLAGILCLSALTAGAFAQGLVTFNNNPNTLVTSGSPGNTSSISGAAGSYYFGLLTSASGAANTFTFAGIYATNVTAPGRFIGGTQTVNGWAPGTTVFYEVAGWSASLGATWQPGWLLGNFGAASGFFGISGSASGASGGGTPPAPPLPLFGGTGLTSGFNLAPTGAVVPEPSTMALAGLGAAALLIFRRRK
jgi:hypothetical protein